MRVAILGAGIAGLAAGNALLDRAEATLYEAASRAGGKASSFKVDGFTFDTGPHISFTSNARVASIFEASAGSVLCYEGSPASLFRGAIMRHPVQCNAI